jgi:tetratricopeptide (TPR) repeat protein
VLFEPLVAAAPPDRDLRLALVHTYDTLGVISLDAGKTREALDYHRRQLQLLEAGDGSARADQDLRRAFASAYHHLADVDAAAGDLDAALDHYRRSLALRQSLEREFPNNTAYTRLTGVSYFWIGDVLAKLHRTHEALDAYRQSLDVGERLAKANPSADGADLTYAIVQIGNMLGRLGRHSEAMRYYRRAETIRAASVRADSASLWKQASLMEVRVAICSSLAALGSAGAPAACADSAVQLDRTAVSPDNAAIRTFVADSYASIGEAYTALARAGSIDGAGSFQRQARDMFKRSVDVWADLRTRGVIAGADATKAESAAHALARAEASLHPPS